MWALSGIISCVTSRFITSAVYLLMKSFISVVMVSETRDISVDCEQKNCTRLLVGLVASLVDIVWIGNRRIALCVYGYNRFGSWRESAFYVPIS